MKIIVFKNILIVFIFLGTIQSGCAQNREYKSIPKEYNKNYQIREVSGSITRQAVSVVKYLPKGSAKNSARDLTQYLQKAIDDNSVVLFPTGKYYTTGLKLRSNSTVIFARGSELILIPSSRERYEILAITGVENVVVYNPRIKGDLRSRKALKGEWGFGIDIRGSRNIKVYSPYITDCLGDGIVISKSSKGLNKQLKLYNTSNILIEDAYIDYMGRNGISIIGVNGLKVIEPIITNIFKRSPMSGIDIEPDNPSYELNNIIIESPFTFNNMDGVMISLRKLVSTKTKEVNIHVKNHVDVESTYPLNMPDFFKNKAHKPLLGNIVIEHPTWINNRNSMVRGVSYGLSNNILLIKPKLEGLQLRSWKSKNVVKLSHQDKLKLHVKDNTKFTIQN